MVDPQEFKKRVGDTVSQTYTIEFLGKNFDEIVTAISSTRAEKIYSWVAEVTKRNIQPISIGSPKQYKDWTMNQLLVFRYELNIAGVTYRILFVKVKNSIYVEFHLGDHHYYDKVRKDLDLKKSSYE